MLAGILRFRFSVCEKVPMPLLGLAAKTFRGVSSVPTVTGVLRPVAFGNDAPAREKFDDGRSVPYPVPL